MTSSCFCYTTDRNYMVPTLLSAIQARRNVAVEKTDVIILYRGMRDDSTDLFTDLCQRYGVLFQLVMPQEMDGLPVNFARHFLDRFLAPRYVDVIHADGDTQITGSLDPLFDVALPRGSVMAAPDPMAVMIHDRSPVWQARRSYFRSIGIPEARLDRYFNSGIFRLNRADLADVGRECVRLCDKHGSAFRFNEQDAFNLAFGEEARLMSFRWNFPIFFLNGGYEASIQPRLVHYMSNPRPWQGAFQPWGRSAHAVYGDLVARHPELASFVQPLRGFKAIKYNAQQHYKRLVERHAWTRPHVLARVARFEREAVV